MSPETTSRYASPLDIFTAEAGVEGEALINLIKTLRREDSAIDPKTRELIGLGIMCALRLEDSMRIHIPRAIEYGATREEITTTIMLSIQLGGVVGALIGLQIAVPILE